MQIWRNDASLSIFQVAGSGKVEYPDAYVLHTSMMFSGFMNFLASLRHSSDHMPVVTNIAFLYGFNPIKFFTRAVHYYVAPPCVSSIL